MPAEKKVKQLSKMRRQSTFLNEVVAPVIVLLLYSFLLTVVLYLTLEPALHPNLHPRLLNFGTYMVHFHPRMCRYCPYVVGALYVLLIQVKLFAPIYWQYRMRSRGLLAPTELKSGQYLNQCMKQTFPVLPPQAWQILNQVFPGLLVKVPGMRGTHWEVLSHDERLRELRLALQYVHDPLSIKCWRLYPRRLSCTAKLTGKGMRTVAELTFSADSAMDYHTVYAIIDQTNGCLKAAMTDELPVECY
jgi:hypothetical protein